ncbi:MAG: DUF5372 family protein [Pseudonocardiaceae bacterium]
MTSVTITRARHPLQGHRLAVLGQMRRHGRLELLAVLPDGSKTLIPAAWTDLDPTGSVSLAGGVCQASAATLGALGDLLHACALVSALSALTGQEVTEQAARSSPSKEDNRAACTAESDTRPGTGATPGPARTAHHRAGGGGDQPAGRPDRQSRRTGGKAGGQ